MNSYNFTDRKVLILGGMGFIGSSLAVRLVSQGAKVTAKKAAGQKGWNQHK